MVAAQFLKLSGLSDQTLGKVKKDLYMCVNGGERPFSPRGGGWTSAIKSLTFAVGPTIRYWLTFTKGKGIFHLADIGYVSKIGGYSIAFLIY